MTNYGRIYNGKTGKVLTSHSGHEDIDQIYSPIVFAYLFGMFFYNVGIAWVNLTVFLPTHEAPCSSHCRPSMHGCFRL